MNQDQFQALLRTLIATAAGSLATHGATTAANLLNNQTISGALVILAVMIWAHFAHTAPSSTPPSASPPTASTNPPASSAGHVVQQLAIMLGFLALASFSLLIWLPGCAHLQPGADPVVVRCEQVETDAKASFDLALHVEAANAPFWATNVPAFHNFCNWLRTPTTIGSTNLPRCSAMLLSLNDLKHDYEAGEASSNALVLAFTTIDGLGSEASNWLTVVTNTPNL
jgi:hypothetical protein